MNSFLKLGVIICLFILLAGIRFFENHLFYDPFISFYKGNYLTQAPPDFEMSKLLLSTSFRYLLNSFLSIVILHVAFRNKEIFKFALLLYLIAFLILIVVFFGFLSHINPSNYFVIFYLRRFLIQPLFILLLLPAFYYQQSIKKS